MKVRMLIAMAISGLFAASLAYAEPVTTQFAADDTTDTTKSMQTPSDTNPAGTSTDANMGNIGAADPSSNATQSPSDNSSNSNNDDMSADTATGDDY